MNLKDTIGNYVVSTVSLPFSFEMEEYETMIIKQMESDNEFLDYQERYYSGEEAVEGHERIVMDITKNGIGDYE